MSNVSPFESRATQIDKTIDGEVKALRGAKTLGPAKDDSRIVKAYVGKIEGTYDVARAKTDTDNAIDLLYIAYNTTPQEEGGIRIKIAEIIDKLIVAQGDSERAMADAMRTADYVITELQNALPDWQDAKLDGVPGLKQFLGKDLLKLASAVKDRATTIRGKLLAISTAYDGIIKDTETATASSETALSGRLRDQATIQAEIRQSKAERDELDSLVEDLKREVEAFDKKARTYEERATLAEKRGFIMQIVKISAQVLAAAIPPIAMAVASGGSSVIAASTLSTLTQAAGAKGEDKEGKPKPDSAKDMAAARTEIATKKAELTIAQEDSAASKKKVEGLRKDLKTKQEAEGKPAEAGTADEDVEKDKDSAEVKGIKGRLKDAKADQKEKDGKTKLLAGALTGLQASLTALAQGFGQLSQEQKDEAVSLREIQMKMLDKAEEYEKQRREQAAKLVKIKALLTGKLSEEEIIKLAIRSLNISLSALKRTKEIVQEIAFFFKSFSDFMDMIVEEAKLEIAVINDAVSRDSLGPSKLERIFESTDDFFIRQGAEWRAVNVVSGRFHQAFADGRTKLTRLSGKYITGDELAAYLQGAAVLLQKIADEREASAKAKLLDLQAYRQILLEEPAEKSPEVA